MQSVLDGSGSTVLAPKLNPIQMNPPSQLLTPSAWTVHQLEGGAGLCALTLERWGLGEVTPKPATSDYSGDNIPF